MISDEIASLLELHGLAVLGEDLFLGYGNVPDTPDTATGLWRYGGATPLSVKNRAAPVMELPRFQLSNRAKRYADAERRAYEMHYLLTGFSGVLLGVAYASIWPLQEPQELPRDDQRRAWFICNYEVKKARSPLM